ncbi:putative F-box domain, FBD domain, leucine-rich repeat domain, L domain-containing protein [Rosa chinensis]|uniref:Putative F-box domain, FBD domain, leucine-rich repeat domain, L domain-containing protein n=1 Tax=Rosa chinensis TaxID=74649 RepID=A0A2P6S2K4_ROSCH|nr:F-box/FBD/LRR-repeat protein At5g22700 [Rosa chinensis]PRQ52910.1 putative F-box domain, FBD domain, leucine-rich repeat domain, L domain-containing protein [Rosa chinensis]
MRGRERKRKAKGDYDLVDRISALPDELLSIIVHSLPVKEAAATSILSRRWKYIWKSSTNLDFSDARFIVGKGFRGFLQQRRHDNHQNSQRYVNSVNRAIEQYSNPTVERFRACFIIDPRYTGDIVNWLQFAMNKKVEILELEFYIDSGLTYTYPIYPFPHKLLGIGEKSELQNSYSSDPPSHQSCGYNIGFKFLKVLHFRCVDVTREVLEYFLSNCAALERLTVNAAHNLVDLRVGGPSIALKHLTLIDCSRLESIEVCDAKLVSFHLSGREVKRLLLTRVPLLVEVSHMTAVSSIRLLLTQLSFCISQLEILSLDINGGDYNWDHVFPILSNLRHLELKFDSDCESDLCNFTRFIGASPHLHRLVLKLQNCTRTKPEICRKIGRIAKFPRHYLKVVEIVGYRGSHCHVQHALYFVKKAVVLEKIVIDPVRRWGAWLDRDFKEVEEENDARYHANRHLRRKVPSTVEFVCLS